MRAYYNEIDPAVAKVFIEATCEAIDGGSDIPDSPTEPTIFFSIVSNETATL